jgi:hypothetical protein
MLNVKTMGLSTYGGMRTIDAGTSCLFTLHRYFGPCALVLVLTNQCGIPLTNAWASAAWFQFSNKASVPANHYCPAYQSTGVTWEDISNAVKADFIPSDTVTRLKPDWESL